MDVEEFRIVGKQMIDYMCHYVKTIKDRRVIPKCLETDTNNLSNSNHSNTEGIAPGYLRQKLPSEAPVEPEKWDDIMNDVELKIMPGVTHWNHPHFFAYFPSGSSFPSILADMLSDVIAGIGFSWIAYPICTELEAIVLDWLGQALGLPDPFISSKSPNREGGGVISGSASECTFTSLLAARSEAIKYLKGPNVKFDGSVFLSKLVAYCSREAHSSVEKACMIVQIKLRILETDEHFSLRGETLEKAIREDIEKGYWPFWVCATLGTTGAGAFDNLQEIGLVCKKFQNIWLHVDAAYAGSGFICPELRHFLKGIEYADSINTNCNKWFLTNFDCSCMWIKDRKRLTRAMCISATYYLSDANHTEEFDYRHWGIPLSRRFRSLKLWFVMRVYGIKGLQSYIRNHISLAKYFEKLIREDGNFEIINEVHLGLVCFRIKGSDKINERLLANINHSGKIHMIPAKLRGKYVIRFCVIYEHATKQHIDYAWHVIKEHADELLKQTTSRSDDKTGKPPLSRQLSRRLSFVRSVSKEQYEKSKHANSLCDGASPILITDEEEEEYELNGSFDDDVFDFKDPRSPLYNKVNK